MSVGRFIAVVGPSGVGKDSVMAGLVDRHPGMRLVRRVITRAPEAGGEDHVPVTQSAFDRLVAQGEFVLHWQAHGLCYGISGSVLQDLAAGHDLLANLSRNVVADAVARLPAVTVLTLTARPETLAARLAGRGRETAEQISARLARSVPDLPAGCQVLTIANDGPLAEAVAAASAALYPASA